MTETPQDRWTRIEDIVDQALDLPAGARDAFLRTACGADSELRRAAEEWLAACADPARFPDSPAAVFAAPLMSTGAGSALDQEIPELQRIGSYRLVRELGRGGMGTVYLAERDDGQLDRRVAIKVMRRGTGGDDHLRRRFLEERQILARLEHPHIATLIDGGITPDGRLYFVMQYVEGAPIDRYCDEQHLPVDARLRIFLNVCAAVHHAHRHQVVHRDLKPGNILVTTDGQAKLLDFGIAKLLEPASPSADLTRTGERLLTPEYASPEQIRGEAVTPASDVHALGVLLHRLLTGQRPFRQNSHTRHELEHAILEQEPTQPSEAVTSPSDRRRLRGDLDAIVLTALRKDPALRYADAGHLADDIRRHLAGQPVRARGRAPGSRLRALAGRYRVSLAAAGAGMLLGAAALAVSPVRTRWSAPAANAANALLAVGRIVDYRTSAGYESAAPLVDMLATNLARTRGLAVVSAGRMYELVQQAAAGDSTDERYGRAARLAGASEIVNGAIYATPAGGVRLDLRRESVASGTILGAYTATGADLFALADSATVSLVAGLGLIAPTGSIADVTTRSLEAYRLYMQGLRLFHAGKRPAADSSFQAALLVDSTFAMAAYYRARNSGYEWRFPSATSADREVFTERFARALRLARNASDRERLKIRAYYEMFHLSPATRSVAETLAVRYPREIDGHMMLGISMALQGELQPAIVHFTRVLAMDSASLQSGSEGCAACVAMDALIEANVLLDSLSDAERYARRWLEIQPGSLPARGRLVEILDGQGRFAEAAAVLGSGATARHKEDSIVSVAKHWIRAGELATVNSLLRTWINRTSGPARAPLLYFQAVALRNQGRFSEALGVARRLRGTAGERAFGGAAPPSALVEAQTLFELGRLREARALFDSIARWPATGQPASVQATFRVQALTMLAVSLHAAGDTGRLAALADSLERDGQRAFMFRPRDQHHFVRGLLHAARGNDAEAIRAFERALGSVTSDFSRANMELAGIYLRQNRPREAIAVLRPAARGWFLETTNLHISLTEVHERLAEAHEMAGALDSAAMHWRRVAANWEGADAQLATRRSRAVARLAPGIRTSARFRGPPEARVVP
jgi:tetratricopeptide (TPR) repeat protein